MRKTVVNLCKNGSQAMGGDTLTGSHIIKMSLNMMFEGGHYLNG